MSAMLQIENLAKFFHRSEGVVHAVNGVSLDINSGDFVAVQGPSGSGKTTLLLMVGGLLHPTQGQVVIGGQDPYAMPPEQRARFRAANIGFVFQQFHLIPYLSVLENVLVPTLALPLPAAPKRACELLKRFGLNDRAQHLPGELSTGERQRVALARALLNEPKLLLADEPTGNLDQANAEAVLGYLVEFSRNGGAVLLVTHELAAAQHASRRMRLKEGKLERE
jgi:putative ABC transport system ATP-binding protein